MADDDMDTKDLAIWQRRHLEASAKIRELEAKLTQAQADLTERDGRLSASAEAAKAWEAERAELEGLRGEKAGWADERALLAAGITDPEGVDFARHAWSRLPADKRPAGGLTEWLGAKDTLPKAVAAYLPSGAGGAVAKSHDPNAGVKPGAGKAPDPAGSALDLAAKGQFNGAAREAYYASLGMSPPTYASDKA